MCGNIITEAHKENYIEREEISMARKIIKTNNGETYRRVSRWIAIDCKYITSRHSLWDYADKSSEDEKEAPVLCFRYNNRLYAIGQFVRFDFPFRTDMTGHEFKENGETHTLCAYDAMRGLFNPLILEIDSYGEHVRLYEQANI